jgi:hypothetical protein
MARDDQISSRQAAPALARMVVSGDIEMHQTKPGYSNATTASNSNAGKYFFANATTDGKIPVPPQNLIRHSCYYGAFP